MLGVAIYHLCVKAVSRTTNRSAVAAAAYRACVELTDERTGRVYDYRPRARAGSLAEPAYIIVPAGLAGDVSWIEDRSRLWNRAEIEAKRKDAKTAREVEVAIPAELDEKAASEFGRAMGAYLANRFRVAVDVARHTPSRDGDDRNRHLHMLMTTREITVDGFGPRTAELDNKFSGAIGEIRVNCAVLTNAALERAGSTARVDHRSYADQGIDKLPGIHLGAAASMERRNPDLPTRLGDRQREIEEINREIEALSVARRDLAAAGQAQRAALIAAVRDDLGLSRSAAPDRPRPSKRMREAALEPPEIEAASVAPFLSNHVADTWRREVPKRRRSRASTPGVAPVSVTVAQDAAEPSFDEAEPTPPLQAPLSLQRGPEGARRPAPPVDEPKPMSSVDPRLTEVQPSPAAQEAKDRVTSDLTVPPIDLAASEAALQSVLERTRRRIAAQASQAPAVSREPMRPLPGPAAAHRVPLRGGPAVRKTAQQSPAASQAVSETAVSSAAPLVQRSRTTTIPHPLAAIERVTADPDLAALFGRHKDAARFAATFQRAWQDEARRNAIAEIAQRHLTDDVWVKLRAALMTWVNGGLNDHIAITEWAKHVPVFSDADLTRMTMLANRGTVRPQGSEPDVSPGRGRDGNGGYEI